MNNESNHEFWAMSSEKYCATAVDNIEECLSKKTLRLLSKCIALLQSGYKLKIDTTPVLKADRV